ncbi:MAG: hypothetical protein WAK63_00895 [Xanthobacteraceae bacterium]
MIRTLVFLLCLFLSVLGYTSVSAQAGGDKGGPTFTFLNSNYHGADFPQEKIIQDIRSGVGDKVDLSNYREVRIAVMNAEGGRPYLVLQLLSSKYHSVEVVRVNLDEKFNVLGIQMDYQMTPYDYRNQFKVNEEQSPVQFHQQLSNLKCPDENVEFLVFAPNDPASANNANDRQNLELEQSISEDVANTAASHGLKVVKLLTKAATHDMLIAHLKCPNLKGVFYDGDANPTLIITNDAVLYASEIKQLLQFRKKVTHIWLACQAFNDPMLSTMIASVESQKYAAGKNNLEIGPSDRAGACAMKAALAGKPMTAAFWACYKAEDRPADNWGFDGLGSDQFGQ